MFHPNNIPLLTKALGAPDLYIPGSDSREKQFAEFTDLLAGVPVLVNEYDDNAIEAEVCESFLIGPTGLMLKKQNPEGIKMIEEHWAEHKAKGAGGMEQPPKEEPNTPPNSNPKGVMNELPNNVSQFPGVPVAR